MCCLIFPNLYGDQSTIPEVRGSGQRGQVDTVHGARGGDGRTCRKENPSNLVQRHLEWERVCHRSTVFLTITFLLRFGRAGKGNLAWP